MQQDCGAFKSQIRAIGRMGLIHRSATRAKAGDAEACSGAFSFPLLPAALLRDALRVQYASFSSEAQRQTREGLRVDGI